MTKFGKLIDAEQLLCLVHNIHLALTDVLYKKCSRYRPAVAQRVGRGLALLFHDRGTRRR